MSISIAVTDGGEVRMAVSTTDATYTMNVNMKPAYARWLASEILAGADRAEKVPLATSVIPISEKLVGPGEILK